MYWLSICIPTNGIYEWMKPVMESILSQKADPSEYEIVVSDNGDHEDFKDYMRRIAAENGNVTYCESKSQGFLNQVDAFRMASGRFIKFLNHRFTLREGAVEEFIRISKEFHEERPQLYFTNGSLGKEKLYRFTAFDNYVKKLGFYSSWSGGVAFWKDDPIPTEVSSSFFPHLEMVLNPKKKAYVIENSTLMDEIPSDSTRKGSYNLFEAFAVDYYEYYVRMRDAALISDAALKDFKNKLALYLSSLYCDFVVNQTPCSYQLDGCDEYISKYFDLESVRRNASVLNARLKNEEKRRQFMEKRRQERSC